MIGEEKLPDLLSSRCHEQRSNTLPAGLTLSSSWTQSLKRQRVNESNGWCVCHSYGLVLARALVERVIFGPTVTISEHNTNKQVVAVSSCGSPSFWSSRSLVCTDRPTERPNERPKLSVLLASCLPSLLAGGLAGWLAGQISVCLAVRVNEASGLAR